MTMKTPIQIHLDRLIDRAIEEGIAAAKHRIFKYNTKPVSREEWDSRVVHEISDAIWLNLDNIVDFSPSSGEDE